MKNILAAQTRVGGDTDSRRAGSALLAVLWAGRLLLMLAFFVLASGSLCSRPETRPQVVNISNSDSAAEKPCIACDASGNLAIAWTDSRDGSEDIWLSERAPGGDWSAPHNVSRGGNPNGARNVSLCFDKEGGLHAAWSQYYSMNGVGGWAIAYAHRPFGGDWAETETIFHGMASKPNIGVDGAGSVHLLFKDMVTGGYDACYTTRFSTGAWQPVQIVNPGVPCSDALLAARGDGTCIAAFVAFETLGSSYSYNLYWCRKPPHDGWRTPELLDARREGISFPALTTDSAHAFLGYHRGAGTIVVRTLADSSWTDADTLCPESERASLISIAPDTRGGLVLAWGNYSTLELKIAGWNEGWTRAITASGPDTARTWRTTSVAVGPDRQIHVTWDSDWRTPSPPEVFYASVKIDGR